MTETPTAAELEISNDVRYAAYDTLLSARAAGVDLSQAAAQVLEAVVRPVVAAELRRIADHFETQTVPGTVLPEPRTLHMVVTRLRARADELDPPTRED